MSLLALIPARSGSKGIIQKNTKLLSGKPLIAWTINSAKQAACVDRIVVSTDSPEIANIAKEYGAEVPFLRPAELASDDSSALDVVLHAIEQIQGFEWLLLLQPTSPLRTAFDIDGIFEFCQKHQASSAVSVYKTKEHPHLMYKMNEFLHLDSLLNDIPKISRRQNLSNIYSLNGSLYLTKVEWLLKNRSLIGPGTLGYCMSLEKSVDLDTMHDWNFVEYLIKKNEK